MFKNATIAVMLFVLLAAAGAGMLTAAAQSTADYPAGYPPPGITPPGYPPPGGGGVRNTPVPTWTPGPPDYPFDADNRLYNNDLNQPAAAIDPVRVVITAKTTTQAEHVLRHSFFARLAKINRGLLYAK